MQQNMTAAEVKALLEGTFPQHFGPKGLLKVEDVGVGTARVRFAADERHIRPGGTVSGPTLMGLSDSAFYVALLGVIGPVPLAVTTSLNINFLRRAKPGNLIADVRLMKVGKRLAIGEVSIRREGEDDVISHCVATYSIPPAGQEMANGD
jgi:uncharacterized protein (TIGR00369 family)